MISSTAALPDHVDVARRLTAASLWNSQSLRLSGNFAPGAPMSTLTSSGAVALAQSSDMGPPNFGSNGSIAFAPAGGDFQGQVALPPGNPYRNVRAVVPGPAATAAVVEQVGQEPQQHTEAQIVAADGSVAAPVALTDSASESPALAFDPAGDSVFTWSGAGAILARYTAAGGPAGPITQLASGQAALSSVAVTPSGSAIVAWAQGPLEGEVIQAAIRSDLPTASFVATPATTLVDPKGSVPIAFACRGAATCFVAAKVAPGSRAAQTSSIRAVSIPGGQQRVVHVRLTSSQLRRLRHRRREHIRVTAAVHTTDGPPSKTTRTVVVGAGSASHRH